MVESSAVGLVAPGDQRRMRDAISAHRSFSGPVGAISARIIAPKIRGDPTTLSRSMMPRSSIEYAPQCARSSSRSVGNA